jgi:hypothetical protein
MQQFGDFCRRIGLNREIHPGIRKVIRQVIIGATDGVQIHHHKGGFLAISKLFDFAKSCGCEIIIQINRHREFLHTGDHRPACKQVSLYARANRKKD